MFNIFKKIFSLVLCVCFVFSFVGCDSKTNNPDADPDIERDTDVQLYADGLKLSNAANSYSINLSSSVTETTLDDAEAEEAKTDGKLQGIEVADEDIPVGKKVVYKKRAAEYGMEDLAYWGANNNITYAGSLLKINNDGTQIAPIVGLKRKPITLSIGLEGATGVNYQTITVDTVTQSSIGQAINELVKGFTSSEAQLPYMVSMQLTEIKAEEEINAALGLAFNAGSYFDFSTEFDFQDKKDKTYAILTLKQIYYTVNVDYNSTDGIFSLLDDSVTLEQLQSACSEDCCPVYVSSVSYGRVAAITLETSESFSSLKAKLGIGGGINIFNSELESTLEATNSINDLEYNCFVYGGSTSETQGVLSQKSIDGMIEALNQPYDPSMQVGMPIYYQLSHIADNSSAKIGFVGEYYYAEFIDKIADGMTDNITLPSFTQEKTVVDNYNKYDKYGAGYIANNYCLVIDVSALDLNYIKNKGSNIELIIEISIREVDDAYQEIYLYNAGVTASTVQIGKEKAIAGIIIEHTAGKTETAYGKYLLKAVISPDAIERDELWIAFDASGRTGSDEWRFKDVNVSLSIADKPTYQMYQTRIK